jgi:cytochrome c-type biogenesis protein CcmH
MIARGDSDKQIIEFMTQRYGDFVLYRPPVKNTTLLLWYGPATMAVLGIIVLLLVLRRRSRMPPENFDPDQDEPEVDPGAQPR